MRVAHQDRLVCFGYDFLAHSTTGLLQGKHVGDEFYRANGDVFQADPDAALNVLAKLGDPEINRFIPYQKSDGFSGALSGRTDSQ